MRTDKWPEETNWTVTGEDCRGSGVLAQIERGDYSEKEFTYVRNVDLCEGGKYKFEIFDSIGDGIFLPGFWSLRLDGVEIKSFRGKWGYRDGHEFFGTNEATVDVSTIHTAASRKLTTGTLEQSDMCTYFYDNYGRLHVAWAHFIEGRLASDCDVEKGVTAISCSGETLTFTVLSASCADAVEVINDDLRSKDEDAVARDFVKSTDVSDEVRDAFLEFLDSYPLAEMTSSTTPLVVSTAASSKALAATKPTARDVAADHMIKSKLTSSQTTRPAYTARHDAGYGSQRRLQTCDSGQVPDCSGVGECCENWIGDGFCDGVDRAAGCDLSCYDNDGGDCFGGSYSYSYADDDDDLTVDDPYSGPTDDAIDDPSGGSCESYRVSGSDHQTARMGIYVASGTCDGKTLYKCEDCSSSDEQYLYYSSNYADWNIGTEGCGSTLVGLYGSGSGHPGLVSQWTEYAGISDGWVETSTISVACVECVCDQTLLLVLKTDSYPEETSWELQMASGSCVGATPSSGVVVEAETEYRVPISNICAGQQYAFEIFDLIGDGICCGYGEDSYMLELNGVRLHESDGQFESGDSHKFTAPMSWTPGPTLSTLTPAPTTPAPTIEPTTPAPTIDCVCDQTLLLVLKTDRYPGETSWELRMASGARGSCVGATPSSGVVVEAETEYRISISNICAGQQYTFEIFDSIGDGICCEYGEGSYVLELNGVRLHESDGQFESGDSHTFTAPMTWTPLPTPGPTPAPCLCKDSWSNGWCPEIQHGCPAVACDGTDGRWCEVDPSDCSSSITTDGVYWIYCGDENVAPTPGSTLSYSYSYAYDDDFKNPTPVPTPGPTCKETPRPTLAGVPGCKYRAATNFNPLATVDDDSCVFATSGCTYQAASNYNSEATVDDGSCIFAPVCKPCSGDNDCELDEFCEFKDGGGRRLRFGSIHEEGCCRAR